MGHFTVVFALIWWPEIESEIWLILNLDGGFLFVEFLVAFCSHTGISAAAVTQSFVLWIQRGLPALFTQPYHLGTQDFYSLGLVHFFEGSMSSSVLIYPSFPGVPSQETFQNGQSPHPMYLPSELLFLYSGPFPLEG